MSFRVRVEAASRPISPAVTRVAVATAVAASALGLSARAEAWPLFQTRGNVQTEQSRGLSDARPTRTLPPTGRYVSEAGEGFVFDRSGSRPLFRFESRNETWALRGTPAPRGDIVYRNDTGDQILRVTPDGGVTLYSVRNPAGSPASFRGAAPALAPPMLGPIALADLMIRRSGQLSRALGRIVVVQLDGERDEALCVDALMVTTDAVMRMAGSASLRRRLESLRSVTIVEGRSPGVTFERGDLRVTVRPGSGLTGRPSSAMVIRTVSAD
ncbi:DUF4908 domain-containing protein [Brevundimonas sp. VNH65]|uniref:DUF4908 domain-containing protein n=1 Tax=Brevundimonas sp. VNH65 TaxID=3400917 RepID=UPI003C10B5FD